MSRKTIDVQFVKDKANYFLANSDDSSRRDRCGVIGILEIILMESDNYHGFKYTGDWTVDESRRHYY